MADEHRLTDDERTVLELMEAAWNAFVRLPVQHPSHVREMEGHIHNAQRIVMSRVVARQEGWVKDADGENSADQYQGYIQIDTGLGIQLVKWPTESISRKDLLVLAGLYAYDQYIVYRVVDDQDIEVNDDDEIHLNDGDGFLFRVAEK